MLMKFRIILTYFMAFQAVHSIIWLVFLVQNDFQTLCWLATLNFSLAGLSLLYFTWPKRR